MGLTLCFYLVLATPAPAGSDPAAEPLVIYRSGLRSGWQDYGWTRRDVMPGQPARVDFFDHGGWIIGGRKTRGHYQALHLWMRAPAGHGQFLAVRLAASGAAFPAITITPEHELTRSGTWHKISIPYDHLNPDDEPFDTITLSAVRPVPTGWVYIDNIILEPEGTKEPMAAAGAPAAEIHDNVELDPVTVTMESSNDDLIGLSMHIGGGMPAGGGSTVFTVGLSARLTFADDRVALGVHSAVSYHTLEVQTGDPTGAAIDSRSQMVTLPMLGMLTLRLPFGPFAIYGSTGLGAAWVWASKETLGAVHDANTLTWAARGAVGAETPVGPGWLGLEAAYLILPGVELGGVFREFHGGGLNVLLHYRLGA